MTADVLYPCQVFFELCRQNEWAFILTVPDGNLPTVWEDVQGLLPRTPEQYQHERRHHGTTVIDQTFRWLNHLDYRGHTLAWLEGVEVVTPLKKGRSPQSRFVHLTNVTVTAGTVRILSRTGRLRWTIENEGFNTQTHLGYGLEHKYARVSWQAAKNYYQCLQIGHLLNQLTVLSTSFQVYLQGKKTCRHLWLCLVALLLEGHLSQSPFDTLAQHRVQIRLL